MSQSRRPLGTGPSPDEPSEPTEPSRAVRGRTAAERAGAAEQFPDTGAEAGTEAADAPDVSASGRRRLGVGQARNDEAAH
ncbi:hypothetical protein EOT10_28520 [Streptomyces antnestii]|uniref:Uncharacterized protein n=1 Tax=Streptomyces antnestii TaxID=2494256 RepID=A0A3S2VSL5_9ACTN|nr:hypothetical protein [Streptomyces sp. San01]RVU19956.1 hypothetical protein EOT10_28520 [Streptomyces sp. San01]